jgi:3-methyladenine DNA glycosylase AlkC
MAEPLKFMYNPAYFEKLCPVLKENIPNFDCRRFIHRVFDNRWPDLELKERVRHITMSLHEFMPMDFIEAAKILTNLSSSLERSELRSSSFTAIFLPDYIEVFGLEHPDISLKALEQITKLVSAEFAIRPFILRYPEKTMQHMYRWSRHAHPHVRRLSSEGCRPRLPWAMGLPPFKKDPSPIIPVLETLRQDSSEFVRKSVANNLNDIAKDHPAIVLNICREWKGTHPNTDWILRHGCRTLLKKGNRDALVLHGLDPDKKASVRSLKISKRRVPVGGDLSFGFEFSNLEKKISFYRLEYAIDYLTSTGKTSRKIFALAEKKFQPGSSSSIERTRSFRDLTTRKHHRGKHVLSIFANGKKMASTEFVVC